MEKRYQPQEFGKMVGMTKRALRYYREKNILTPDFIDDEGNTYYSEQNMIQAQQISILRYLGISIEGIKEIQKNQTTVRQSLKLQKNMLQDRLRETKQLINAIEDIESSIDEPGEIKWNHLLDMVCYAKHDMVEASMMKYYEERAEEYDDIFSGGGPASCKPEIYQRDIAGIMKLLKLFGGENCIDIACGTGYWLQGYYQNCQKFTFLDAAPHMLRECKKKVQACQLLEQSEFIKTNFFKWEPNIDAAYDCAVAGFLLGHFTTIQETEFFHKVQSILKPGGRLLIIDNAWTKWRAKEEHKEDIEKRTLSDGRTFSIYKKYFEKEEIKEVLTRNHFTIMDCYWGQNFFGVLAYRNGEKIND